MRSPNRRRLLIAAAIAGLGALAVAVGVGVYGLVRGSASDETASSPTASVVETATAVDVAQPRPLTPQTEPDGFARGAASALFDWDTRDSAGPADWAQVVIDVGDPDEAVGLASDVRSYLPTLEQWDQLETYGTRQWLAIEEAYVPEAWETAIAQAAPGQLPPGATAYTIVGTRHRDGIWDGDTITTATEVRFTVFIACPRGEECRLLRLSRLNEPLE
jgi:hypothetical protein